MSSLPGTHRLPEAEGDTDQELREPKWYRVILHNDDYTTMDFVIEILVTVFHKPAAEATRIMLDVHQRQRGVCGTYTHDIAATKVAQVHLLARQREFPLKCSLEEA
jgi:ATP-dependent Clp protease adaptor protein ClpS